MEQVKRAQGVLKNVVKQYHAYLDKTVPLVKERWAALGGLLIVFLLRVILAQGWYVVCYALFIFLLNMFLAFLSPKIDPSLQDDLRSEETEEGGALPVSQDEDFRPFIRRLPEFKFWLNSTRATLIALFCSFIPFLNVPVFWPILVVYFVILLVLTMRRQIEHMMKYRYIPFDIGKKRFNSRG